jgi:hypothetical protein
MDQPEKDDDHLKLLKDLDFFSFTWYFFFILISNYNRDSRLFRIN